MKNSIIMALVILIALLVAGGTLEYKDTAYVWGCYVGSTKNPFKGK